MKLICLSQSGHSPSIYVWVSPEEYDQLTAAEKFYGNLCDAMDENVEVERLVKRLLDRKTTRDCIKTFVIYE